MRLFGKDVTTEKVLALVKDRLEARGLLTPSEDAGLADQVEPRIDPFLFQVEVLTEHADATAGLPIETHRPGPQGQVVVLAKQVFRKLGQVFINEALARQTVFNGHVRDGYAQLAAEVTTLRQRVAELEAAAVAAQTPPAPAAQPLAEKPPRAPRPKPVASKALKPRVAAAPNARKGR